MIFELQFWILDFGFWIEEEDSHIVHGVHRENSNRSRSLPLPWRSCAPIAVPNRIRFNRHDFGFSIEEEDSHRAHRENSNRSKSIPHPLRSVLLLSRAEPEHTSPKRKQGRTSRA
jgi:hypothetical protein